MVTFFLGGAPSLSKEALPSAVRSPSASAVNVVEEDCPPSLVRLGGHDLQS